MSEYSIIFISFVKLNLDALTLFSYSGYVVDKIEEISFLSRLLTTTYTVLYTI